MQFNIEVVEVTEEKNKKNSKGGVFNAANVVYRKDGKVEAKSFPDWANKNIYPSLLGLEKGKSYTVTTEKVNGFWQWLAVGDGSEAPPAPSTSSESSYRAPAPAATGKVLGSNYETPAERALKQKYIIAQSSISAAISCFPAGEASPEAVLVVADKFYAYVFNKAQDVSDIQSDLPE
jgi:hypothetical protein